MVRNREVGGLTMDSISAKQSARKWGITVRWVRQCRKNGRIPGTGRLGNSWIIPTDAARANTEKQGAVHPAKNDISIICQKRNISSRKQVEKYMLM